MFKRFNSRSKVLTASLAVFGLAAAAAPVVNAEGPSCRKVHARVFLAAEETPTCGSAIGLCAGGELVGTLTCRSSFIGTSFVSTVDTPSTAVAVLTGDNRIENSSRS